MRFRVLRAAAPARPLPEDIAIPYGRELRFMIASLRDPDSAASVGDPSFDRIYPAWARIPSRMHWTPVQVARRAAELAVGGRKDARVLDVGSGVGKFCLVGSLTTGAIFHGVEQRPHFVALSRAIQHHYRLDRLAYFQGDMRDIDWKRYTGIYLFNPFQENLTPWFKVDSTIEPRRELYDDLVSAVEERLARMPEGTRVVTYHGFGGEVPGSFRKVHDEYCAHGPLVCWMKA